MSSFGKLVIAKITFYFAIFTADVQGEDDGSSICGVRLQNCDLVTQRRNREVPLLILVIIMCFVAVCQLHRMCSFLFYSISCILGRKRDIIGLAYA